MNWSERMLGLMHRVGNAGNKELKQAEMLDTFKCKVGGLVLEREDYFMPEGLKLKGGDTVIIYKLSHEKYVILAKVV